MKYCIRKAKKSDVNDLLALIQELARFEKAPDAVSITAKELERDGFGSTPLFECFVAEVEDKIVGMALFYPRYSTWEGPTYHLEDLIVEESMKQKGIGTALYQAFISYAHAKGVQRIEWVVLDWNSPAIEFYQKSGARLLTDWHLVQMDRPAMQRYIDSIKS